MCIRDSNQADEFFDILGNTILTPLDVGVSFSGYAFRQAVNQEWLVTSNRDLKVNCYQDYFFSEPNSYL